MRKNSSLGFWACAIGLTLVVQIALGETNAAINPVNVAGLQFAFSLVKELARQAPDTDVFISPYSVAAVLQMLSNGARGQTQDELKRALGTTGLEPWQVNAFYQTARRSLSSQTNSILNIANALWCRAGSSLNPEFAQINHDIFGAELSSVDFSLPSSATQINAWADRATHGKIPQIVSPPLPPNTAMILASAIYFKGTWLHPFDATQTHPRAFHPSNGSQVSVPMMIQTRSWRYHQGEGYQAVQLPYSDGMLGMEVLLPANDSSLTNLLNRLEARIWSTELLAGLREQRGTVVLPKFTLRFATDLKSSLRALGINSAFGPQADFLGISSGALFVSQVKHNAFVDVNEKGTEAAAVTTGVVALTSLAKQPPPFQMVVDRPFLFIISDLRSGLVLFVGLVHSPAPSTQ